MILTAEMLHEILSRCPGEYELYFNKVPLQDLVEIDVSGKKIILKN